MFRFRSSFSADYRQWPVDALTNFIATLPPREPWLRWSYPLHKRGLPAAVTLERRRALVSAVVSRASGSVKAVRNLLEGCFLLHNDDLPWIIKEACSALGGPLASVWSTLAQEVARGFGGAPYGYFRAEGVSVAQTEQLAQAGLQLPPDYERWTPPRSWNPLTGTFAHEHELETSLEDSDVDEEPILKALADWRLLTIQTEAGGRPDAPAVPPRTLLELADHADRRLVCDTHDSFALSSSLWTACNGG